MLFLLTFLTFFISSKAVCPNGSIEWQSNCYFFQNNSLAFVTAEETCNSLGGYLTSIHDGFTDAFLAQNSALQFHDSTVTDFWVGGTDMITGNWTWTDGSNFTFTDWNTLKNLTGQDCLAVTISNGKWSPQDCFIPKPYVCAISATPTPLPFIDCGHLWFYFELTGYCYGGSEGRMSYNWQDAETYCENNGGHLASVHSDAELAFFFSLVQFNWRTLWIGLFSLDHEKTWHWTDGSPVNYMKWQTHNLTWSSTSCVVMGEAFIDTDCTALYQPLCQRLPKTF